MTTKDETNECAVWYWHHYSPTYQLCDDEDDAASMATYIEDQGNGVIMGVQFRDGRTVTKADWNAYRAKRTEEDQRQWAQAATPARPSRTILDPFEGKSLQIDVDAPAWLGRAPQ